MRKIILLLFCLFVVACGESGSPIKTFGDDRGETPGDGDPRVTSNEQQITNDKQRSTNGNPRPTSDKRPATSDKIPGYVCNSEGICISEKRAKALTPHRDALGYFTNIVGRPYDPCKEDGDCQADDDDQGEDKE